MVFHSFQHFLHISCKFGHYWKRKKLSMNLSIWLKNWLGIHLAQGIHLALGIHLGIHLSIWLKNWSVNIMHNQYFFSIKSKVFIYFIAYKLSSCSIRFCVYLYTSHMPFKIYFMYNKEFNSEYIYFWFNPLSTRFFFS